MGMVLSAMPVGEYDRRLVILTKEKGRISAFARGARRQNSMLMGCSQSFVFGMFTLYQGRDSYSVNSAEIENYFEVIRNDLEIVSYASYFCEFATYLTRENVDGTEILKLLYQSFRALEKKTISNELIRAVFELKILSVNGEAPQVFECVRCKRKEALTIFHTKKGGLLCKWCGREILDGFAIKENLIYTLQYIVTADIQKLYTFTVSCELLTALKKVAKDYVNTYVDMKFKSLELLELFVNEEEKI